MTGEWLTFEEIQSFKNSSKALQSPESKIQNTDKWHRSEELSREPLDGELETGSLETGWTTIPKKHQTEAKSMDGDSGDSAGEPTRKEKEKRPWPDVSWEAKFAYCSKSWLSGCWKFGTRRRVNQEEKHLDWSQSRHSLMRTQKGLHNFLPFLDWLKISPRSLWEAILSTGKPCMKSMLQAAFHRSLLLSDVTLTASPGHSSTAVPMLGFVCLSVSSFRLQNFLFR